MSIENPLWGAPRIHGELLKLGIDVAQSTVSIYMVPRQGRPLQTWRIYLRNHVEEIASIDLFAVPTRPNLGKGPVTNVRNLKSPYLYKFLFDLTDGGNWLVDVHASG